tara:strand:- start:662 stop:1042 length:381 start_codon:yes stop_codon:yes gene_type:complete
MNELGVDQAINLKIKSIIEQIENLGDEDRLQIFDKFGSATSDANKKSGPLQFFTQEDVDLANQMAKFNENLKTESYLNKLEGNDPNKLGVAGFQKRDIAGRDKDRLLTGGALIGDMLTRMALINKL